MRRTQRCVDKIAPWHKEPRHITLLQIYRSIWSAVCNIYWDFTTFPGRRTFVRAAFRDPGLVDCSNCCMRAGILPVELRARQMLRNYVYTNYYFMTFKGCRHNGLSFELESLGVSGFACANKHESLQFENVVMGLWCNCETKVDLVDFQKHLSGGPA